MVKYISSNDLLTSKLYSAFLEIKRDPMNILNEVSVDGVEICSVIKRGANYSVVLTRHKYKGALRKFEFIRSNNFNYGTHAVTFIVKE